MNTSKHRLQTSLQKNSKNDQKPANIITDDLAEIIAVWPSLPEHIKATIRTLTDSCKTNQEEINGDVEND